MDSVIQSPSKYVQGADALQRVGEYLKPLADSWLLIADNLVLDLVQATVQTSLERAGVALDVAVFNGECSQSEIDRLSALVAQTGCRAIVGMGGGKALDTAKAVVHGCALPVAVVPTIASTDAPCSALSVIYTEEGVFERYLLLPSNPALVLVDTQIVAQAPARLLASGMGDALATWFEARASSRSYARTMAGGLATQTALALAKLCYDTLLQEGENAMLAAQAQIVTPALERVVEANTYLSGVGFESGGLGAAHAVHNGLTAVAETHQFYHGEKVAFGVLVQLALENAPAQECNAVMGLCQAVGLPITLAQLGVTSDVATKMQAVAQLACAPGETIHNMPGGVTAQQVYAALLMADQMGQRFLARLRT